VERRGRRAVRGIAAWPGLAVAVLLGVGSPPVLAREEGPWQVSAWRSLPALEWERHQDLPPWQGPPVAFFREEVRRPPVEVLGFLPYWNVGTAVVPMDRITTLAYFAVSVNGDGSLGDSRDWGSPTLLPLVQAARTAGVRVVLAVTCFDGTQMGALVPSAANRGRAVEAIVDLVLAGGGEGVNVDFEGLPVAQKAAFVTFVRELKAAMDQALGHPSQVTVDTPAVDWSGAYDYDLLALAGDGLVIMGYDYHYRGGDPGPVAPARPSDFWGKYSLQWTLDDYDRYGGVENRGRFWLALPLYGYDWPATSTSRGAKQTGNATARFYADCQRRAAEAGGFLWDGDSDTPWFATTTNGVRQTWCENQRSLTTKVGLAASRGLGGVAFWALGYEESLADPWVAIEAAWPADPGGTPEAGADGGDMAEEAGPVEPDADVPEVEGGDLLHWPDGLRPRRDVPAAGEDPTGSEATPAPDAASEAVGSGEASGTEEAGDLPGGGFGDVGPTRCQCSGCQGGGARWPAGGGAWALLVAAWALSRRRRPLPGRSGRSRG